MKSTPKNPTHVVHAIDEEGVPEGDSDDVGGRVVRAHSSVHLSSVTLNGYNDILSTDILL
jgi:hypothetical protein